MFFFSHFVFWILVVSKVARGLDVIDFDAVEVILMILLRPYNAIRNFFFFTSVAVWSGLVHFGKVCFLL